MKEADLMRLIQMEVSRYGARLHRNNIGQLTDATTSRVIRFGVANPGGSDLIGWTRVPVTEQMVGKVLALFTAIEVKSAHGRLSTHQRAFIDAVIKDGGIAGCARSIEEALQIVGVKGDNSKT